MQPAYRRTIGCIVQIDISHRACLQYHEVSDYRTLADDCIELLSKIGSISSVIVCGSLAKHDIVPGWSDIDLIVFVSGSCEETHVLDQIWEAIHHAKGEKRIGIGIDIVYEDEFLRSHKFCGRPYMMTYEVAFYGERAHGGDPLRSIIYDDEARQRVEFERPLLIAAEVNNWRRAYIARQYHSGFPDVIWTFNCAKALLRLLQCETGPNLSLPINCASSLQNIQGLFPDHPALGAFVEAVELRRKWPEYQEDSHTLRTLLPFFSTVLNSYLLLRSNTLCHHQPETCASGRRFS